MFERKLSFWLSLLFLSLLFFPKINLISLGATETAGIRIDDILLFFLLVLIGINHYYKQFKTCSIEKYLYSFVILGILSWGLNRLFVSFGWLHVDANLLYALRLAEYFLFFYIGRMAFPFISEKSLIIWLLFWNLTLMSLQKLELLGQFGIYGYLANTSTRVTGIASFPSEAGVMLNLFFVYLIYSQEPSKRISALLPPNTRHFFQQTYVYWSFLLICTFTIFTGSRVAVAALIWIFLFRIKQDVKIRSLTSWGFAILFVGLGTLFLGYTIYQTASIFERSAQLISYQNLELVTDVWNKIDITKDPLSKEIVRHGEHDMSWWMRIHKWMYVLKLYLTHPECYLQGIGPGFALSAVDGGYLRLLTENGLAGCILFFSLLKNIAKQSLILRWSVIAILINMIFFDAYLAYKPMSLLFLMSGFAFYRATSLAYTHQSI